MSSNTAEVTERNVSEVLVANERLFSWLTSAVFNSMIISLLLGELVKPPVRV